jgi:hypothetical protein
MRNMLFGSAAVAALFIGGSLASAQTPGGQGPGAQKSEHSQPAQTGRGQGTQGAVQHQTSGNSGTERGAQNEKVGASSEAQKGQFGQARAEGQQSGTENHRRGREDRHNAQENRSNSDQNRHSTADNRRNGDENRRNTAEDRRNGGKNGRSNGEGTRQNAGTTTREGGSGSKEANTSRVNGTNVSLSTEQRGKIRTAILGEHVQPARNVNFQVRVGVVIPSTVVVHPLPTEIVTIEPAWSGFEFFLVGSEIVIVDPGSLRIIAVMPA